MEESVDVKALRDRFNSQARVSDTSSSPKSLQPGLGRAILPMMENNLTHRLAASVPPPSASPGLMRFSRAEPPTAAIPSRPACFPRPPPVSATKAPIPPGDTRKVKQTGEMLQNMMLRHQRSPGTNLGPARSPVSSHTSSPITTPFPLRHHSRQRSSKDVSPLRKPLPPEGPLPLKPKRPPHVNLEPFLKFRCGSAFPGFNRSEGSADRKMSSPTVVSPPEPPLRSSKPNKLQRQIASVDFEDEQDPYDDVGSFEKNESFSDNSSHFVEEDGDDDDNDDVYEMIDEEQLVSNHSAAEKPNKKEAKRQQEQERKEQLEKQKKQNELKKNFQIQGELEALHTARARHDWRGEGKLDLSLRQGESVEILRVENNPRGKWLARSMNGNYGYISNTCVDIDYEAVKRKMPQLRKKDTFDLPPPPPDPPMMLNVDSSSRDSLPQDDDDYDDVQPMLEDFPPPPLEISIDPKVEKDMKKKFKYEGPVKVLQTMMVDPNYVVKKVGAKDLQVTPGEIVDVIQQTSKKKYLCQSRAGKYGYVSTSFLLRLEGEIYDDVDYPSDVYDNDFPQTNY
ncbi:FYN-binding protein 1 [Kryptolebias marmoratus]|uniref:FYN-binding protein 1 n=1 Tax=Kryptolebias marmoratus TaxID=37003 RepID=A0A3Q2ZW57_KRYMA|nr:FYN-binding protein 1 [Kryptolebias marmoratus]